MTEEEVMVEGYQSDYTVCYAGLEFGVGHIEYTRNEVEVVVCNNLRKNGETVDDDMVRVGVDLIMGCIHYHAEEVMKEFIHVKEATEGEQEEAYT